ncbi:MAG: type IX secretion system membrane protein PorP/SprF, partial [Bacteroidota bacterium]
GNLQRHFYFVTGYEVDLGQKVMAEPAVLFKATTDSKLQVDGSLKFTFDRLFWRGGSYRSDDAIVAFAGVSLGRLVDLTYAYDITTSGLQRVSMGSHELSVAFRFERLSDSDGDGIADAEDPCPDLAGSRKNGGCPEDLLAAKGVEDYSDDLADPDEDGVFGDIDDCPTEAGPKENRGCPLADQDFDGIIDAEDECPTLAGASTNRGCPIDDRDRDGIVDQFDQCPDEAGPFVTRGCPDLDTDKDGTVDTADQCPNTFGPAANLGCPVVTPRELEVLQVAMRNLYFDSGKTQIWGQSAPHLDNLAELMMERSDWQLEIIGHTDSRGSAKANLIVSRKRAENVKLYLQEQGVPENQIIISYAGETEPFGDNLREGGRQLNRRVELEFVFD